MCRILFAIIESCRHYKPLHNIKGQGVGSIFDLTLDTLKTQNTQHVIFDFDGVLSAHGEARPDKKVLPILQKSLALFGHDNVFILSNKPLKIREDYFKQHLPQVQFIYANRKKPYPDGLQQIIAITKSAPNAHSLIDDRLLTGGLATCLAGTNMVYINKPLQNFQRRFFVESFFQILRSFERLVF